MTGQKEWWAVHIFLFDPQASESCLVDDVMPAVRDLVAQGKASDWFFIRYWEGGPHLRLRLANIIHGDRKRFLEALQLKVEARMSENAMTRDEYYAQHSFDGESVDVDALPWYGDGQIVEIAYEPETVRYGGPQALLLSEGLFSVSSELAVQIVGATRSHFEKRLAAAFVLMLAAASIAGRDAVGILTFCHNYGTMWARYSEQTKAVADSPPPKPSPGHVAAVASLVAGRGLSSAFAQHWYESLLRLRDGLEQLGREGALVSPIDGTVADTPERIEYAIVAILWSQVHMLNNRLAVMPTQEVLVARAVAAAAREHVRKHEVAL
jgi:thiopeptide-type bacteriocin biosynthesis protein